MTYHLAVDIGASSGRHILGWVEDGMIKTEEIYRFVNNLKKEDNKLIWDTDSLLKEVKEGIRQCKVVGKLPATIAIDTWGVDYALLDSDLNVIKPVYCYRDSRTERSIPEVEKLITKERMYELTGIQKQTYNTVYQLYADKMDGRLDKASHFLLMPAFLSFGLTLTAVTLQVRGHSLMAARCAEQHSRHSSSSPASQASIHSRSSWKEAASTRD